MSDATHPHFIIVGGGLAGALLANYLGQSKYEVDVYEMRDNPLRAGFSGGRSINLALSHRGIEALRRVGLADRVLASAVAMPGRMIHSTAGHLDFQPYGKDAGQSIHSVSRGGLNTILLQAASEQPTVRLHFNERCTGVDLRSGEVGLLNTNTNDAREVHGDIVISADGAFSAVRASMQKQDRFDYSQHYLEHGYKELVIPPGPDGAHRLQKNALHIWPRRAFMMIALPNADGSFTCTLFWPFDGPVSFNAVRAEADLMRVFREHFADAIPHMPTLAEDFFANPVGSLVTVRCGPWYVDGRVLLIGDAAHAVVPFYGQGMNAAFEDVQTLAELLDRHGNQPDWHRVFAELYALRKENTDTLADLAIENFREMRDRTGSKVFLWKKRIEHTLAKLFPRWYLPLYMMVTFTRIPYALARRRAGAQDHVATAVVILFILAVGLIFSYMR